MPSTYIIRIISRANGRSRQGFASLCLFKLVSAVALLCGALSFSVIAQEDSSSFIPVSQQTLSSPNAEDWLMWRRTYDSWGFSPLESVTAENVNELELVWDIPLEAGIQEGTPLVYQGIMYMPHPGDVIQALDASSGELLWEYRRDIPADLGDYIAAITTNRALALYQDVIVYTSNDDYLVGLDAITGELRYETQILDYHIHPAQQSSGPIIIEGMAVSGRGCMPQAGPDACVITAHDAITGVEQWRLNTIQRPEEGDDTWGDTPWEDRWHVGAWMMPSYDPELELIYMGTSVTAPAPKFLIQGNDLSYLYHNSTLAIKPEDGEISWYYQHVVDHWDLDHPFERLLVNTHVVPNASEVDWINPAIDRSKEYRVITGIPGKTGLVYTLDRETGEFLWARDTVYQNVVSDIDGETGAVTVNPEAIFNESGESLNICPSPSGGKNWQAGAYSPLNNAMFYSLQNTCAELFVTSEEMSSEDLYGFFSRESYAPGKEGALGSIYAISAETGETLWTYSMPGTSLSLLTTAGGIVFGGDVSGQFRALDQRSGELLWDINLGSPVTGYPISFGVEGKQYIAVSTGNSVTTSNQSVFLDMEIGSDNHLYIFALP